MTGQNPSERLTRLDVVQRRLRTAVRLFFEERDPVATYTLAAAAEEALSDLLRRQGKIHPIRQSNLLRDGVEHEVSSILSGSRKFFTQASTDPDDVHQFPDLALEYELFVCSALYSVYRQRHLREGWVFFLWFGVHHADVIAQSSLREALESLKSNAPTVATARKTYLQMLNRPDRYPFVNVD